MLRFAFRTIELPRLDWQGYVGKPNPVALALVGKMRHPRAARPQVRLEALKRLGPLGLAPDRERIVLTFLDTYLPLAPEEEQRYNQLVEGLPMAEKEAVLELTNRWEQLGLQKGRQEGLQQGRQEGLRSILLRQLERRFGPVPAEDRATLEDLRCEALEELAVAVVEVESYAAWRKRLGTFAGKARPSVPRRP